MSLWSWTLDAVEQAADWVSDFIGGGVRDKERDKRAAMKAHARRMEAAAEHQSRGHLLDMLSHAQADAWAHVDLLKHESGRLRNQAGMLQRDASYARTFEGRHVFVSFKRALDSALALNDANQFYWHALIQKWSERKHRIVSAGARTRQRLKKHYFDPVSFEDFTVGLPIRGIMVPGVIEKVGKRFFTAAFAHGISAKIPRDELPALTSRWGEGTRPNLFVSRVDYRARKAEVHLGTANILRRIEKHGFDVLSLACSYEPVRGRDGLAGYALEHRGARLFLPLRLALPIPEGASTVDVRLVEAQFDPFKLIATAR